jgi:hypothetical protein
MVHAPTPLPIVSRAGATGCEPLQMSDPDSWYRPRHLTFRLSLWPLSRLGRSQDLPLCRRDWPAGHHHFGTIPLDHCPAWRPPAVCRGLPPDAVPGAPHCGSPSRHSTQPSARGSPPAGIKHRQGCRVGEEVVRREHPAQQQLIDRRSPPARASNQLLGVERLSVMPWRFGISVWRRAVWNHRTC